MGDTTERIGVLGGTFDPVHIGHLVAAADARAGLKLDRVLLVVAGDPWQKRTQVVASAADRLALVELAVEGIDGLEASSIEVERDGASVTADTLEELTAPGRELFLLLGADAVSNMSTWKRLDDTRSLATVVVVERAGEHAEPPGDGWCVEHLTIPRLDVSSTEIRDRLAHDRPIDGLVAPEVVRAIRERGLYTDPR
ncbi:MAG: nicotinate (nicotinamide) nucleotide adenylyltransferase [Actinobacteria bacterium]|nr:nicotinate (nicotinamide) nucleotide adenylyltransferase [Actinomycetota bacterium]